MTKDAIAFISEGGSANPDLNPVLRTAISEALKRDVPKSTITNLLKKFEDTKDKNAYQRLIFEGRIHKKIFFVAIVYTDKVPHARHQMTYPYKKHLVDASSTKRLFDERGVINAIARSGINADNFESDCLGDAIECGAEDIEVHSVAERQVTFLCGPRDLMEVRKKLATAGYQIEDSDCIFFPNTHLVELNDAEAADYKKFKERLTLVDGFEEIYDNLKEDDENS